MKKRNKRSAKLPERFPCGCRATRHAESKFAVECLPQLDGSRICKHGRKWVVVWQEVKP